MTHVYYFNNQPNFVSSHYQFNCMFKCTKVLFCFNSNMYREMMGLAKQNT